MLKAGDELRGVEHGGVCRIEERLGEGGQGEVYLVAGLQGPFRTSGRWRRSCRPE